VSKAIFAWRYPFLPRHFTYVDTLTIGVPAFFIALARRRRAAGRGGQPAGAGLAAHIHQHVVPRWTGDANFLPIVARTKAVPAILADTRALLSRAWESSEGRGRC